MRDAGLPDSAADIRVSELVARSRANCQALMERLHESQKLVQETRRILTDERSRRQSRGRAARREPPSHDASESTICRELRAAGTDDAELLKACDEFHAAEREQERINREGEECAERTYQAIERWDFALEALIRTTVRTPEGLRAKARVLLVVLGDWVITAPGRSIDESAGHERLAWSLASDILGGRIAGPARPAGHPAIEALIASVSRSRITPGSAED